MISSVPRPVHSGAPASRRTATLPASPRFGKTVRSPHHAPKPKLARRSLVTRQEEMRISAVMKRLCATLWNTLKPAARGNLQQREKDIANALRRIRLHNLDIDKPKPNVVSQHKPFRARA